MLVPTNAIGLMYAEIDSAGSLKQAGDRVLFGARKSSRAETEWLTRQRVSQCLKNISEIVHQYGGIVASTAGDKIFCHLPNAKAALEAAIDIQRIQRNDTGASDRPDNVLAAPLGVRIALHFGPLEVDAGRIHGVSAAFSDAILSRAEPDHILASTTLRDALPEKIEAVVLRDAQPFGEVSVDGSAEPLAILNFPWQESNIEETAVAPALPPAEKAPDFEPATDTPPPTAPAPAADPEPQTPLAMRQSPAPAPPAPELTLTFKGKQLTLGRAQPTLMLRSGEERTEHARIFLDGADFYLQNIKPSGTRLQRPDGREELCLESTKLDELGAISLGENFDQSTQVIRFTIARG